MQIKPSSQLGHFNVQLICVCMLEPISTVMKVMMFKGLKGNEANKLLIWVSVSSVMEKNGE